MEVCLPKDINKFFWSLFPFIFVLSSLHNFFSNLELKYGLNELEDFGRILFILGITACESALIIAFLWWILNFLKKFIFR